MTVYGMHSFFLKPSQSSGCSREKCRLLLQLLWVMLESTEEERVPAMTAHPPGMCGLRGTSVTGVRLGAGRSGQDFGPSGKTASVAPYAHDTAASR